MRDLTSIELNAISGGVEECAVVVAALAIGGFGWLNIEISAPRLIQVASVFAILGTGCDHLMEYFLQ